MKKVKKGDVLFVVTPFIQEECVVKGVGHKHITIEIESSGEQVKFRVKTWKQKTPYAPDAFLFESKMEGIISLLKNWKRQQGF